MPSALEPVISGLLPAMDGQDIAQFRRLFYRLRDESPALSADELSVAVQELAVVLARKPEGVFAGLAWLAALWLDAGASAAPLAEHVPLCTVMTMWLREQFSEYWPVVGGGRPEPDPHEPPAMQDLIDLFVSHADRLGLSVARAEQTAVSWYDVSKWVELMVAATQQKEFRDAAPMLDEIGEAAQRLADTVPRAGWLPNLVRVLDDEELVVLEDADQATRRGYRLTASGIADNYQLHTLLADRLIGDPASGLLAGERPRPAWVARATTDHPACPIDDPIRRRILLFDGTGHSIALEGHPADIPRVDGIRVLVARPPHKNDGWLAGRVYMRMQPTLTLDHIMTPDEAATWHARISPARSDRIRTFDQGQGSTGAPGVVR